MYISKLYLNPRSPQVRAELHAPYQLHRTILKAFPDKQNGGPGRVLFRIEPTKNQPQIPLIVQSEKQPNWNTLPQNHTPYLTHGPHGDPPHQTKPYSPTFHPGQRLAFRLRANPTIKRQGKRIGLLTEELQAQWLHRKAQRAGFTPITVRITTEGFLRDKKHDPNKTHNITLLAVRYDGILQVNDPQEFLTAILNGIGPAKALGFGLLSVAPA